MTKTKLKVVKYTFAKINQHRKRGQKLAPKWWIEGLPYDECGRVRCGPYDPYEEARSDCRGMQHVFDDEDFV